MNKNLSNLKMMLSYAKEYMYLIAISAAAIIIKVGAGFATPQIIRFTVDSVIGDVPFYFGRPILDLIYLVGGIEGMRQNIWICAVFVLVMAVITCI
ncbi:MAG TPA: hypothetical protein DEF04_01800, partial [Clostridiales bacterium]|nr:hypothetical protein [Clostridiales bacterium]